MTIARDKGKPVAKQGRKAVNLRIRSCLPIPGKHLEAEIVWLPKAVGESPRTQARFTTLVPSAETT